MAPPGEILQRLPSVHHILQNEALQGLIRTYSRGLVVESVQDYLEELRTQIRNGKMAESELEQRIDLLEVEVRSLLEQRLRPSLRTVVNATGVIIHTNIGRAPISEAVARTIGSLATTYSNLEYELAEGKRGHRDAHFERRVVRLLGCEAATACNNNAAAVFLILNTLACGRKVLVSRGELIEIGGSFRMPAIMERSGAILKEVGTTNKTRLADYRDAADENTALILRVHPSNYKVVGFTHRPGLKELVAWAREKQIPLVEDLGSGYLFETEHEFLKEEPSVRAVLAEGVDLACFSGDKLLGGPQAGIIVGRRDLIGSIRKNPLMRACRLDKVTYGILEQTLIEYEKDTYQKTLPVYQMLSATAEEVRERTEKVRERLEGGVFQTEVKEGYSLIGGGAAPESRIPTWVLAVRARHCSVNDLERQLRCGAVPILARIEEDWLILDLRTVFPGQEQVIVSAFDKIAALG